MSKVRSVMRRLESSTLTFQKYGTDQTHTGVIING